MEDMAEGIQFAHEHGVKVYVTANILAHNGDLEGVREYFTQLKEIKPDALIISDPGIYTIAKEICPEIERHISTQANNTNYGTYQFWWNQGAKRVVTARELSLNEIAEIRKIFRMKWKSRHLCMEQCVFPIPEDVFKQLFYRKRCQPGSLHSSVPLEICSGRGKTSGRVSAGL